jgi:O-antigen ligase
VPLCAGVVALLALERPTLGRGSGRLLDWSLVACLAVVAAQLVPLSATIRDWVSPHASQIDRVLSLEGTSGSMPLRPLSIDGEATAWALALGAAYIGLFFCARSIFSRAGVRRVSRGVTWLGLGLTVLVGVQRATSPSMLYWVFRPLHPGASPYGPFVSRNALATWLAMAIPIAIGYAVARDRSDRRSQLGIAARLEAMDSTQTVLVAAACLMIGAVLGSTSRAGILGMGSGLLALLALSSTRIRSGRAAVWAIGALAAIALMFGNFGALAMRLQGSAEAGAWGRPAIWRDTWRMTQDFWLAGVGAGAYQKGMLLYQQGSRVFFFNQAHDEYLQLAAEGGLLLAIPAAIALVAGTAFILSRLRSDRTPIFWIRAGAIAGIVAVSVQNVWDTGLRTPANGVLFAVIAAIAVHKPRESSAERHSRHGATRTLSAPPASRDLWF